AVGKRTMMDEVTRGGCGLQACWLGLSIQEKKKCPEKARDVPVGMVLMRGLFLRSRLFRGSFTLFFHRCLGGRQSRDRHAEGGATHIGKAEAMAKLDAGRFAAVFAADPELDVRTRLASEIAGDFH